MALDYDFRIATDLAPPKVLSLLSDKLGLKRNEDNHLIGPGIVVSSIQESALGQSVIEEAFGFQPSLDVGFRLDPNENYEQGKNTLLQATMELLHQISGDAVLLFNGEQVVLQRIGGKLVINEVATWHASGLTEVALPYERYYLPSPLL